MEHARTATDPRDEWCPKPPLLSDTRVWRRAPTDGRPPPYVDTDHTRVGSAKGRLLFDPPTHTAERVGRP